MEAETRLVNAVLDTIIPPAADGTRPGAGSLDLGESLREASGPFWTGTLEGLQALNEEARQSGGSDFSELPLPERSDLLARSQESQPGLLSSLVFQTYSAYYRHPQVLEALGLEARPPFPKGFEVEDGDLSLLDPVRQREPFYRKTD